MVTIILGKNITMTLKWQYLTVNDIDKAINDITWI